MPKFLVPGHKYLGPGNPYPNGKPTNSSDEIAQRHDKSYIDANNNQDILNSDWSATKEFAADFVNNPSFGSAIGAVGLGVKTAAERVIGVQYPDMSLKRHHSDMISSSDDAQIETSDAATNTGTTGGGGGAGVLGGRSSEIYMGSKQQVQYGHRTLKKTYYFYTTNPMPSYTKFGNAGNTAGSSSSDILYAWNYIQSIPVDRLRLYMSPREEAFFREQFSEVNCEGVKVNIKSLGARGQFSTGGTAVTNANMQLQPFICRMHGIDTDYPTTILEADVQNFLGKLEGSTPYNLGGTYTANPPVASNTIANMPARTGSRKMTLPLQIVYPNPFSHAPTNTAGGTETTATQAIQQQINLPNTWEYLEMKNGAVIDEKGQYCFSYSYKPKNKYLFGRNTQFRPQAFIEASAAIQPQTLMQNNAEYIMRTQHSQSTFIAASNSTAAEIAAYVNAYNEQPNDVRIENQYQHNGTEVFKPHRMPLFNVGVMPLRNAGEEIASNNQLIQWEFLLECEIDISFQMGVSGHYGHSLTLPEPKYMFPNIQKGAFGNYGAIANDVDRGSQIKPVSNRTNVFGRKTMTTVDTPNIGQGTGSTTNNITPTGVVTRSARAKGLIHQI